MKFLFDLDGTITKVETLPLIAKSFGLEVDLAMLTEQTIEGKVPFVESFIKRVYLLRDIPVDKISKLLQSVELHKELVSFIKKNRTDCIIVTGNLGCWIGELVERIGCEYRCSTAEVYENRIVKLSSILKKQDVVNELKRNGEKVVYIGDGNNDLEAMRMADISIAVGLIDEPAGSIIPFSDYLIYNESTLCRQLNRLL